MALPLQPEATMRVLIVDDYPGLVELYDLTLGAHGFEVVGAATVAEAMSRAASEHFDAAVVDVQLPDGSGVDLVEALRRIPALTIAPMVGISAFAAHDLMGHFDAYLAKPFPPQHLASLLRRLCNQARRRANPSPLNT